MGELAEMMLDGTLCQYCGPALIGPGEEPLGFPQSCDGCWGELHRRRGMFGKQNANETITLDLY